LLITKLIAVYNVSISYRKVIVFYYLTTVGKSSTVKRKMVANPADRQNFPINANTVATC